MWVTAVAFIPARLLSQTQQQSQEKESTSAPQTSEQEAKKAKKDADRAKKHEDSDEAPTADHSIKGLGKDFLKDQEQIWTSPAKIRWQDTEWLVPLSGISAGLFVTDHDVSSHLSTAPKTLSHYKTFSDGGAAALIGGAAGMWLLSYPAHNEHWRETGFLAGESAIDALVAVESLKYTLRRDRPFQGDGSGPFFQSGGTSFPSEHAAAAWAVAGVIAHEYPGPIPRILAYGLASFVSYSRIRARQHFPSDVFIGGLMGQFIAQDVYSRHYNPELGGSEWRSVGRFFRDRWNTPGDLGSPYVPLDSWVYPAIDRLAGLGLVDSGFAGQRPWTRLECERLVNEAADQVADDNHEAMHLIDSLQKEFQLESTDNDEGAGSTFRVESVYSRTEYISGMPLQDGYHFAQTQINDFGRPFGEGWNTINGGSAYATSGPWVAYVRGEWQTAPAIPALSLTARQTIRAVDFLNQTPPGTTAPATSQFELLDAYVGLTLSNWQFTFGRQSLWWGPGDGSPLMFSDNAAPIDMFRINRVSPLKLPSIFGWLGPMRLEFFIGQLRGQQLDFAESTGFIGTFGVPLNPQPMIHGERFSFKPTKHFEFGFSRTSLFAGEGVPFTIHSFLESALSLGNGNPGTSSDPGDRRSGMDWSYRVPKLRDWLTFYGDAFTDDQVSPIAYLDRSAIRGGLYLSHTPGIQKLDFRVEGVYTDLPAGGALSHGFFYFNDRFLNGYTNAGNLIGSWIGREGQGAQAWTNYWLSPRNRLQFNFRHQKVSQDFIPGGGTLTDVGVRGDYTIRPGITLSATVQHERWLFPVIQPGESKNVSGSIEILFEPQKAWLHIPSRQNTVNAGDRP
ncbi:MAG TPA: capsule assembly Wzi family protein [Candidatus Acidoferrum sp.]